MLTDDQLAARIGPRLRAELAGLPTPDMLAALRRRRAHRARVTAALTTLPVAAAAIAAAVFLPGPAAPATQDTAYVVSHVTQALDAMPADTIMFGHRTWNTGPVPVEDTWTNGSQVRIKVFTRAGQLAYDAEEVDSRTASTLTRITVNYLDKTWSRYVGPGPTQAPTPSFTCASVILSDTALFNDPSQMAAWLRAGLSCGTLKADGTATVDGVTAIKLKVNAKVAYFVNPTTYLPVRLTATSGSQAWEDDLEWLPPTTANLAKLNLAVPPRGFTRVSPFTRLSPPDSPQSQVAR
ncbi:MAG: hypothetical protein JWM19_7617 [Actinomycetia bacterium]|nr:hypothetical protein [Actinomycetes bacterium]